MLNYTYRIFSILCEIENLLIFYFSRKINVYLFNKYTVWLKITFNEQSCDDLLFNSLHVPVLDRLL